MGLFYYYFRPLLGGPARNTGCSCRNGPRYPRLSVDVSLKKIILRGPDLLDAVAATRSPLKLIRPGGYVERTLSPGEALQRLTLRLWSYEGAARAGRVFYLRMIETTGRVVERDDSFWFGRSVIRHCYDEKAAACGRYDRDLGVAVRCAATRQHDYAREVAQIPSGRW